MFKPIQVAGNLWRSNAPTLRSDYEFIKKQGIKTVLCLEEFDMQEQVIKCLEYDILPLHVPMSGLTPPSVNLLDATLKLIRGPELWPILVHCVKGWDRTGVVMACLRMVDWHWSLEDALKEKHDIGTTWYLKWWDRTIAEYAKENMKCC